MRTLLVIALVLAASVATRAQKVMEAIGQESCSCLKGLDLESYKTADDLEEAMGTCLVTSAYQHEKELAKQKGINVNKITKDDISVLWKDVYQHCSERFDQVVARAKFLEENTVVLSKTDLMTQSTNAICDCMTKKGASEEHFKPCVNEAVEKFKPSLQANFGDNPLSGLMSFITEVSMTLMDQCEVAQKVMLEGRATQYKSIGDVCPKMKGAYYYDAPYVGRTNVTITDNTYQEFDEKGTAKDLYTLSWTGCQANLIYNGKDDGMQKKGDTTKIVLRRVSPEGYLGILKMGPIQTIVEFRRKS